MRYLSVCSGIDAASVAWEPLGWEAVAFSEIEKFPSEVLAYRFPGVENLGDMNGCHRWNLEAIDILVGGTPCQSFSVAGLRKGLSDPRGNLCLTYLAIANRFRPKWIIWENVPGVLSSAGGRDFGSFLGALVKLGYGWSYRILDAQFFGVPQRRRRVFVVGHLGDWQSAAAVLFEPESMCGNPPPGPSSKKEVARTLRARAQSSHREDSDNFVAHALLAKGGSGRLDPSCETYVTGTLVASHGNVKSHHAATNQLIACTLPASDGGVSSGMHPIVVNARQDPDSCERCPPLDTDGTTYAVCFTQNSRSEVRLIGSDGQRTGAICSDAGVQQQNYISENYGVRRLTPREYERLQGFPDDFTLIPRGKKGQLAADGPRYKALGNSMAVPVMRWIGDRIARVG